MEFVLGEVVVEDFFFRPRLGAGEEGEEEATAAMKEEEDEGLAFGSNCSLTVWPFAREEVEADRRPSAEEEADESALLLFASGSGSFEMSSFKNCSLGSACMTLLG